MTNQHLNNQATEKKHIYVAGGKAAVCILSLVLTLALLIGIILMEGINQGKQSFESADFRISERFGNFMTNSISTALEEFITIEKVYVLSDSEQIAPTPSQANFGQTNDPASLQWLINQTYLLMDGQELLFSTDTPILENSVVNYYHDDTILVFTWKQPIRDVVYTISEIKIAHPTQLRRFLADGEYGSNRQYLCSEMSSSVNAVVASAGDFYKFRSIGTVVINSQVMRFNQDILDTCFIDDNGDLIFSRARELADKEATQKFVDENNIRFSLCFGPILIENGERCVPGYYPLGEIGMLYSRAAICQMDDLHYLLVTANAESSYRAYPTIYSFAEVLESMGCEKAYALDGGQTATIVMNNEVINQVSYGAERYISDIIYFATAIPETQ